MPSLTLSPSPHFFTLEDTSDKAVYPCDLLITKENSGDKLIAKLSTMAAENLNEISPLVTFAPSAGVMFASLSIVSFNFKKFIPTCGVNRNLVETGIP